MKYKFTLSFLTLVFFTQSLFTQNIYTQLFPPSFYRDQELDTKWSNSIGFRVENSNFLKNNEYFNNIIEGYTLIGWFLNPKFVYYPAKNVRIEAGGHFLMYDGTDKFTKVLPTLSVQYKVSKSVDIVLGTLYGNVNHHMIEPVFRYEYFFTDNIENGLQVLIKKKHYRGDIWINWQNYIFKGDDDQEVFTLGLSNYFLLTNPESNHRLSIPLQILFVHHGGQINETSKKMQTHNNSAIGLSYAYKIKGNFLDEIGAEQYYAMFYDISGGSYQTPYIMGYGIYSVLFAKAKGFILNGTWWYSDHYISLRGHPIFQSKSTRYTNYYEQMRAFITGRLMYEYEIIQGLDVGAGFELYGNLYDQEVEYWYMFYINFNRDFFIKKFKNN